MTRPARLIAVLSPLVVLGCSTSSSSTTSSAAASSSSAGTSSGASATGTTTGSTTGTTTTSGTTGSTSTRLGGPGQPPAAGPQAAPTGTTSVTFAFSELFLGDTDRSGNASTTAWQGFGYNIAGLSWEPSTTDHCQPAFGATPATVFQTGPNGLDNSFGANVLPILEGLDSSFSALVNQAIESGAFTELVSLTDLGAQTDANPLSGVGYIGGALDAGPAFDGGDVWPIDPSSLASPPSLSSATAVFQGGYLVGDTWVSGTPTQIVLPLRALGTTLPLVIHSAILTMQLSSDHSQATDGVISGVLDTSELASSVQQFAGDLHSALCQGVTACSILTQIAQASDIGVDGTQDPTQICDGISIGLGFNAALVTLGSVGPAASSFVAPCGDAGVSYDFDAGTIGGC